MLKKCSLKFSLLKKAILELGVWEPQKYFHIESVHCLSNIEHRLFFEHLKVLVLKEQLGPNVEETMDRLDMKIFLGLPDTQSQYGFFQKAKFKRALLVIIPKQPKPHFYVICVHDIKWNSHYLETSLLNEFSIYLPLPWALNNIVSHAGEIGSPGIKPPRHMDNITKGTKGSYGDHLANSTILQQIMKKYLKNK